MAGNFGGISFTSSPLVLNSGGGATTPVGSGFTFDLPLSSVAWFTNQALNFQSTSANGVGGFMGNVIQNQNNLVASALQTNTMLNQEAQPILSNYMTLNAQTAMFNSQNSGGGGGLFGLLGL